MVSFVKEDVMVFGNVKNPYASQTIVKVVNDETECKGQKRYPVTPDNLLLLNITPKQNSMEVFHAWTHMITPFFICIAFAALFLQ